MHNVNSPEFLKLWDGVDDVFEDAYHDYRMSLPPAAFVAEAGAMAVVIPDRMQAKASAKVVSTYVKQIQLGQSIYDYPAGGWEYGA